MRNLEAQIEFIQRADNGFFYMVILCFMAFILEQLISSRHNLKSLEKPFFSLSHLLPIWGIVLITILVRIPGLFASAWYDETFTAALASLPAFQAWLMLLADVHPPLAYIPFWLISHSLGAAPYLLRLPSFAAGLAVVYVLYRIAQAKWGEKEARRAAILGALMPALIWFSTEARGYSFLCLAVLLALLAIEENRRYTFIAALALLPLIHAYGYLYAFVIGGYALVVPFTNSIASVTAIRIRDVFIASIPGLLWLPFMAIQSSDVANGFWIYPPNLGTFFKVFIANTFTLAYSPIVAGLIIPLIILAILGALSDKVNRDSEMIHYWLVLFAVPVLAFIISWLWHPIFLDRALFPSATMLILFFARIPTRSLSFIFLALSLAIALPFQALNEGAQKYDFRGVLAHCENQPIYSLTIAGAIVADYYSDKPISIHPDWNNLNQEMPFEVIDALGYIQQAIPAQNACIYWQVSPQTRLEQIRQLERFKLDLGFICTRYIDNSSFAVEICLR